MENILENNKLIAEFMECKIIPLSNLFYNESWDWLMPVVEKLENSGVEITIGRMYCEIKYKDLFDKDKTFEIKIASGVKINAVNGAIVEFLKWYNEQTTKENAK